MPESRDTSASKDPAVLGNIHPDPREAAEKADMDARCDEQFPSLPASLRCSPRFWAGLLLRGWAHGSRRYPKCSAEEQRADPESGP